MFELRWILIQGAPEPGDINVGGNLLQQLEYRARPTDVDEPFDHKNAFGDWMPVPLAGLQRKEGA